MMESVKNKKIWIIGASSGIGAALAVELAKCGADLTLSARRKENLDALMISANIAPVDVSDVQSLHDVEKTYGPFDSVIFMAASYQPGMLKDMNLDDAHRTVDINIKGALNVIHAVYPGMCEAKSGQIVLCGSVAGFCGLPNGQPYSLTKAAIINLAESLKVEAKAYNIDIKVINPGFVRTPLTDKNNFDMPMMIEPDIAARIIADALTKNVFEIHFPKKFTFLVKLLRFLPYTIYFKITRTLMKRMS